MGSWAWSEVASRLAENGHPVLAPDFSSSGGMNTHRGELTGMIDSGEIETGAILVAHSYAGMPATAATVDRPGAIAKIIYLDAYVPRGEQCAFDILPDLRAAFEAMATEDGYVLPLPLTAFGISDPEMAAWIESKLRPWPLATHTETAPGVPESVETAFIQLAAGHFFDVLATELDDAGWTVERADLAHLAPLTHPAETAELLLQHCREVGTRHDFVTDRR
ncbi:alpha/beta hydrolase [Nocardia beijingensis]|nr:alpha/beta hydrolase [Nocardia beijingensis]